MHRPLIVVGTGMQAELVEYHFGAEGRQTAAFVLDPEYLREDSLRGRPVLDFAEARRRFPPETHDLFVSIGFTATAARQRWFEPPATRCPAACTRPPAWPPTCASVPTR
jgi:hypothetical protein